ncbi:MAG: GAF domain-containing protein, partial [Gemmatimonadetes bacterium]|nr:GAF domain-containing protein [Gemmatimonadota bacterium]
MSNRDTPLHERALHMGSQFESLLVEISGTLTRLRPAEVGQGVESVLERLGAFLQVDHAFVVDLRHESDGRAAGWFNSQPGPEGPAIAGALRTRAGWLRRRVEEGDDIVAAARDEVPEPFQTAGALSLLMVPLAVAGTPLGVLGLATSRAERLWPAGFIRRTRLIGEILAAALLRGRADRSLEQGSRFERVVADLAAVLLDPPDTDPDLEIEDALEALGEIAAVNRVRLFRMRGGGTGLELARTWTDASVPDPDPGSADNGFDTGTDPAAREPSLRWLARRLTRGEDVVLASLDDLPPGALRERRHFESCGTGALARLPLYLGNDLVGVLGLDAANGPRDWSDDLLERMRFAGRILLWAMKGGRPGPTIVTHDEPERPEGGTGAGLPALES